MRQQWFVGLFVLFPALAFAQAITPADLEDHVVETSVTMDRRLQMRGREVPNRLDMRLRVKFLRDNAIEFQMTSTSHMRRGAKDGPVLKGQVVLGVIYDARSNDGGQAAWYFEHGTLTSLRTFGDAGGFKRTISFSRNAKGLNCTASASYFHEDGIGRIATRSVIDNAPLTILSAKQVSSTCKVSKASGS